MLQRRRIAVLLLLLLWTVFLWGCSTASEEGLFSVHVIDVGQGDSILVKTPEGKVVLIDGGDPAAGKAVVSYLRKQRVKAIDILIATHPHADHIGGLIEVIEKYPVNTFYMPQKIHTSKTFERLMDAVQKKDLHLIAAKDGIHLKLEEDVFLYFLGPLRDYGDDLNNWSAVVRMDYKEKSFLFTGDLEALGEEDLLKSYPREVLYSHFLKVGHHGSSSSTTPKFLEAVSPQIAVISCGKDNSYGHPHREVMERLQALPIAIYRTDMQGTIVIKSDGKKIWSHQRPYNQQ